MTKNLTSALDVFEKNQNSKPVARIALNGYDINAGGIFPSSGAMRSFIIVEGDLWDQWNDVSALTLKSAKGQSVTIRVAALPVEDDGYGLIEFI